MKAAATDRLVIHASVTLAWCFPESGSRFAESVLDRLAAGVDAIVPAVWPLEVANALLVGEKRGRLAAAQARAMLRRIADLPIVVEPTGTALAFGEIFSLARAEQLTTYDAAYLELAIREALPLATLDAGLSRAARRIGIDLITA